jgi:hypothetical protein
MKHEAFSSLLVNFAIEYAVSAIQVNEDGLKLNGTHQLVAYADDDNVWCKKHTYYKE